MAEETNLKYECLCELCYFVPLVFTEGLVHSRPNSETFGQLRGLTTEQHHGTQAQYKEQEQKYRKQIERALSGVSFRED